MFRFRAITFILQALPEVWVMKATTPVQFWDHLGKEGEQDSQMDVAAVGPELQFSEAATHFARHQSLLSHTF